MRNFWGRWFWGVSGVAAVEFSLIGLPFILMTLSVVEMAIVFTSQSVLQNATFSAARLIRTGQLQQGQRGDPEQAFREAVCDFAELAIRCDNIQFSVSRLDDFSDADDLQPEFDEDGNLENTEFEPGAENDVVLIRVVYNYAITTPIMQQVLSDVGGNRRSLMSTIILQTEPYNPDGE